MHCSPYSQAYCYVVCACNLLVQQISFVCTSKSRQNENLISWHIRLLVLIPKEVPLLFSSITYSWTVHNTPEVWWNPETIKYFVRTSTTLCVINSGFVLKLCKHRVLENPIVPHILWILRFMFTTVSHLPGQLRGVPCHYIWVYCNITLPSMCRFFKCSLSFSFHHKNTVCISLHHHTWHITLLFYTSSWFDQLIMCTWRAVQIMKLFIVQFSPVSCYFFRGRPNILLSIMFSESLSLLFFP